MRGYKQPSLRDRTLKVHINEGKEAGKWPHDYDEFERMRHIYKLTIAQMQRNFRLKAWRSMQDWWRVDDEEHARETNA